MAKQVINVGTSANDGTGDKIRVAFQKTNANFTELYDGKIDSVVAGTNVTVDNTDPLNPIVSATGGGGSQNLQQVTDIGNTVASGDYLSMVSANLIEVVNVITNTGSAITADDGISIKTGIYKSNVKTDDLTVDRIHQLPDADGTIALTTDVTDILTDTITDGDTTHAPDGNAVFDALVLKQDALSGSGVVKSTTGTISYISGTASQYIRGDGQLADFPTGGGGGGSSVSYYLNGSVTQGTFGGNVYKEMNKTPILGTGTDFTINADGYITQFITDANDPNSLLIPAGNWNFETYFSASSAGGSPSFYVELYKYSGTTFTLIASNGAVPELISLGTSINPYFSALAVPETVLLATDRLAIRIFVTHSGRTITLHTEDSHLCQVITTFTTGLQSLNGLTAQTQYFDEGTSGTDFNISSATDTHTFNLPTASATNRGALSSADWSTFNDKQPYAVASFVSEITFDAPKIFFNFLAPTGATLTSNLTGAKKGVVQKIYVNHATNPVTSLSGWVNIGTGAYTPSVANIIFAEWTDGSRVEYWIVKA